MASSTRGARPLRRTFAGALIAAVESSSKAPATSSCRPGWRIDYVVGPIGDQLGVQTHHLARGLDHVAPFFIDADARSQSGNGPIGGLTVISFPNNHLIYALTWFALAFMLAGRLFVTFGGGLFRRQRFVHEPAGGPDAVVRRTGSDAGTIIEPT